jgi:hypothetical protein
VSRPLRAAPRTASALPSLRDAVRVLGAVAANSPSLAGADATVPPPGDKPPAPYKPGETTPPQPPPKRAKPERGDPGRIDGGPMRVYRPGHTFWIQLHPHAPGEPCIDCGEVRS